jgi:hypothetical protein
MLQYDNPEAFNQWYAPIADRYGLVPKPEEEKAYDYLGAFLLGYSPGSTGHWPSEFKSPDHARRHLPADDTGWPTPPSPHGRSYWDTATGKPSPIDIEDLLQYVR